jgi:hypothetical protein
MLKSLFSAGSYIYVFGLRVLTPQEALQNLGNIKFGPPISRRLIWTFYLFLTVVLSASTR